MMFRVLIICIIFIESIFAQEFNLVKEEYKIIDLGDRIKSIKVSNKDLLFVEYNKNAQEPFTQLIAYGKDYGRANVFVTYQNRESESIWINVQHDIQIVQSSLNSINDSVILHEYKNNKFILKGDFKNIKEKNAVLKILSSSDINGSKDIMDMSTIQNPPTIAKIKMYIVEMNNQNLDEFKSNTFIQDLTGDTQMQLNLIDDQSLTLDGMFTSMISHMGSQFNIVNALKVLKQKQLANILDESTLTVMEGEQTVFHSGGTIYVRVQGTTAEGQPISELRPIEYGIKLNIVLNEVSPNNSMLMTIDTDSTTIDWDKQVDGIPGFGEKSIQTKISARNNQAIVLSGLVSTEDSKVVKKIPLLGDIPILGRLFRSESFKKGKSELMFFLIPELQES